MKSSIWLTVTHPISLHRLALPGQSRNKKQDVVEEEIRAETATYSGWVGSLYPPLEMFLTQKEEKITDFCFNINAKQEERKTKKNNLKKQHVFALIRSSKQKSLLCSSSGENLLSDLLLPLLLKMSSVFSYLGGFCAGFFFFKGQI